ncbi:MAG: DUF378 domain-containing protein [Parcubacteria group bacterium]|nr:DUF378 domain-containing protein [Parcubacteria group bacterium]
MNKLSTLDWVSVILVIIGGLNWGIIGLFGTDVVSSLGEVLAKIIFILVGLAALYLLITINKLSRK